ncbi:hypothetical protein N7489_001199 [Penicillium chrysogenum]|uniref:Uncharacterized protein n=1 Tax=Penicillium chrysogenum TaxID=5076 RepID=A0ABQ8WI75_PENCH|nr:uncharacterized protein N7489_001199 [Penicillium chrysogenum]KAJ5250789.1 hypothetical protein N7489_001199 [Penicillium chrysogenum]KAJ5269687.1 hypothetical protein N7505_005445 [Penicillium chrysogenum]KAJ6147583.1 hypothetical protein N7497_009565 [Penicillium chrysogenum]
MVASKESPGKESALRDMGNGPEKATSSHLDFRHAIVSELNCQWESVTEGRTHVAEAKHTETATKHNTADSSPTHKPKSKTGPDHSNVIRLRVPMSFGGKGRAQDKLIMCRLVGLLVGFPFQPSSVCQECYDSNHDDENDYEDKHHPAVPVRPVALMA